jgi:CIC family chloride channel protein
LGLGFHDLNAALEGSFVWSTLLLLLCGKWLATVACYGSGGSGGIFAPCLFMGAMCGALWGEILELIGIIGPEGVEILAVTGMCALLCAVVRAPATAILIVFEMTHDFAIIPALMLGTLTALWVGRHMCPRNFYNQVVHDDGIDMEHHRPPETFADWKQRPVSQFANFSPCCVPLEDVEEARKIVERTGWRIYPVVDADGKFCGAATREAIARATDSVPVAGCGVAQPSTSARKAQQDMLESALDFLVVLDARHRPIAVLTLHDLVRVQLAVMKE